MTKVKWKVAKLHPCLEKALKEEEGVHLSHSSKYLTVSVFLFKERQLFIPMKK